VDVDPEKNTRGFPAASRRDFAVEQGAGNAFLVFGHDYMVADTGLLGKFPINMVKYK
jgi:hypothetical protein